MPAWLKLMRRPPAACRPAPFWSWNGKLEKKELLRQVGEMERGGMGGFFMHVRIGLETEYLSPEFMGLVKAVVEEAKKRKLEAWLYDEDRWPSGFGGGRVTAGDPDFRIHGLLCQILPASQIQALPTDAFACFSARIEGNRAAEVCLLAPDAPPPTEPDRHVLIYRVEKSRPSAWFNNETYLDVLNPKAVRAFIDSTYEAYHKVVGEHFGKTIPGIFTDEPNFSAFVGRPQDGRLFRAWTPNLPEEFLRRRGYSLREHLVELTHHVAEVPLSLSRHDYFQTLTELYVEAFSKQIGEWCGKHQLELTGHFLAEETLSSQTNRVGACMPHYEHFQRPGIDFLTSGRPEVLTAKQASSAASQLGRPRVLSELFGCTGWDCSFEEYKHIGDWHQALGINHFCPHLSWYAMKGGAKRDYPASIFHQSPWWGDFPLLADYFGRLSLALSQGQAIREVAVLHPIESSWLLNRRDDHQANPAFALSGSLNRLCFDLLDNQFDFDFLDESLLPRYASLETSPAKAGLEPQPHVRLRVGQMSYRAVLVPESTTLRSSTLSLLEEFQARGGRLVFVGKEPFLENCRPSDRPARLAGRAFRVPHSPAGLAQGLTDLARPAWIQQASGGETGRPEAWVHLRQTPEGELLFIHHRSRSKTASGKILWRGSGPLHEFDLFTGRLSGELPGISRSDGREVLPVDLPPAGARLFLRRPGTPKYRAAVPQPAEHERCLLHPLWDCELDEPNGITLDYCRLRLTEDGRPGPWSGRDLIWRHERDLRKKLGFCDLASIGQPYLFLANPSPKAGQVEIEYLVTAEAAPAGPLHLVLEHPENFEILLNGNPIPGRPDGWFIDRTFVKVPLKPAFFRKGVNTLVLKTAYREDHWLEDCYLIGRFGAKTSGERVILTGLPKRLAVGDWCAQGLPMYSGAVTYKQTVRIPKSAAGRRLFLGLEHPKATLVRVEVNGHQAGTLAWAPWELEISSLVKPGQAARIAVTLVSSRRNLLGPLHHIQKNPAWTGPSEFRAEGALFQPQYNLVPYGILGGAYLSLRG